MRLVNLPRRCQSWSFNRANYLSVVTAKYTQDVEQAEEQIVNGDIKCDGRHDVVGFTTINDLACFEKNQTRHQ